MYMLFKATGKGKRRGEAWVPCAFTPVCWTQIPVSECTLNLFIQMLSRDLKLIVYQPDFLTFSLKLLDLWSSSSQLMAIHFSSISDQNFEEFVYTHTHTHTNTHSICRASLMAQTVKNLPVIWKNWVWSWDQEDPLKKRMATYSSILSWGIPWIEEPGRQQSMGSQSVGYNWATNTHNILKWKLLSRIWLFATPWTVACQPPMSLEFFRQKYWSGLLCPPPGDPPNPEMVSESPALQADSLPSEPSGKPIYSISLCMLSHFYHARLFVTLWTVARQAPLSMEFFRQDTGVSCHFLLQGIFLTQESNLHLLCLLHLQADSLL